MPRPALFCPDDGNCVLGVGGALGEGGLRQDMPLSFSCRPDIVAKPHITMLLFGR